MQHTTMAVLKESQPVAQVRAPPWHLAAIAHAGRRFTVTEQLSDQGRKVPD